MRKWIVYSVLWLVLCPLMMAAEQPFVVPEPNLIDYLMADEQYEQVIRLASEELTRHPKDGRLYSQRAVAYILSDEVDKAIVDLSKAIRYYKSADKPLGELYRIRAILYEYTNQPRKAQRDYRRAAH